MSQDMVTSAHDVKDYTYYSNAHTCGERVVFANTVSAVQSSGTYQRTFAALPQVCVVS